MGRPSKLTPETTAKLVQAIKLGATYEHACNYAGIAYNTFNEWMKRGESAKRGKFLEFYESIKKAQGDATVGWLAKIEKAASDGNWQAAAWKLERRHPNDYGKQVQAVDVTTGGDKITTENAINNINKVISSITEMSKINNKSEE